MHIDPEITEWLHQWSAGDDAVETKLIEAIYPTLVQIASRQLARQKGVQTLSTRDLAHEAFLQMGGLSSTEWQDRHHFFNVLAKVMRRYVIDYIKAKATAKRSGTLPLVSIAEPADDRVKPIDDWLGLDQALSQLERLDSDSASIVELKFFTGLTTDEIVSLKGISRATVVRRWRFAKSWLAQKMSDIR